MMAPEQRRWGRQQQRARRRRRPSARAAAANPQPPPPTTTLLLLLSLLLLLVPIAAASTATPDPLVRVFIDEGLFLEGETEVLRAHASASPQGALRVTGESTGAFLSVKGYYAPESWDLYVTVGSACRKAWPFMRAAQLGGTNGTREAPRAAAADEGDGGGGAPPPARPSSYLPHQWVSCVPGAFALTAKRAMVETLQEAYGELAFTGLPSSAAERSAAARTTAAAAIAPITPRAYALPGQYWAWRSYVRAARLPPDTTWVLKREVHRGKGVSLLPQREAARKARPVGGEGGDDKPKDKDASSPPPVLVQSFLRDQLLVEGRRSYVRVWMAITSVAPVRAYLFDGGFAIFSSSSAPAAKAASAAKTNATSDDGGVVNLWNQDRSQSRIWELKELAAWVDAQADEREEAEERRRQGRSGRRGGSRRLAASSSLSSMKQQHHQRRWRDAWRDMRAAAGLAAMAAAPTMRADAKEGDAPPRGTFEYFGLDFVLDASGYRPWLLEVNAVPSMARRKRDSGCAGRAFGGGGGNSGGSSASRPAADGDCSLEGDAGDGFDAQKERFVHDVLSLIGAPVAGGGGGDDPAALLSSGPPLSAEAAALRCAAADAHALLVERRANGRRSSGGKDVKEEEEADEASSFAPPPPPPCDAAALAALARARAPASSSSSSTPHPRRIPARDLLPLLCDDEQGGSASPSPPPSPIDGGGCWRPGCLSPGDLAALAEAEAEASRRGRLVPVHDALAARRLNRAAVALQRASGYDGKEDEMTRRPRWNRRQQPYSPLAELARRALPSPLRDAPAPSAPGALSRLRAWFVAWLLPESGAPQLLRARPRVDGVVKPLELTREDYLLAAWARTRVVVGEEGGEGGDGARRHNGPRARLRRLARECFAS
jgi:hypothetical protein